MAPCVVIIKDGVVDDLIQCRDGEHAEKVFVEKCAETFPDWDEHTQEDIDAIIEDGFEQSTTPPSACRGPGRQTKARSSPDRSGCIGTRQRRTTMQVRKVTVGFVVQVFDTERRRFVSQEFVAGDQCDYEDEKGNPVDRKLLEASSKEAYLPFRDGPA